MSIRIGDGKKFFKFCLYFLISISAVLQTAQLIADSAGNIAAGALIQTNTLYYCIFWIFLQFSERFLEVEDCFVWQAHTNNEITLFEIGYMSPFVSVIIGIKFLFAACKKRLATACKIQKILQNKRIFHAVVVYLPAACKRVTNSL